MLPATLSSVDPLHFAPAWATSSAGYRPLRENTRSALEPLPEIASAGTLVDVRAIGLDTRCVTDPSPSGDADTGSAPQGVRPTVLAGWRGPLAIALSVFVLQLAFGLPGALVWDDLALFRVNDLYTKPARLAEALSHPLGLQTQYWRPAATTSFLVDALIHDASPTGLRVSNAVLHAITSALLCVAFRRLLGGNVGLVAGFAWALHPVHVETSAWASARFDLLSGLFTAAALVALTPDGRANSTRARWGIGIAAGLALLSKENAVVLPALVALWSLAMAPRVGAFVAGLRSRVPVILAVVAGLFVVLVVRYERLQFVFRGGERAAVEAGGALEHLLLVGRAVATYVAALVMPWTVGPAHHGVRPIPAGDVLGWSGLAALAALVTLAVYWLPRDRRWTCLLGGFLVGVLPVSQLVPLDLSGGLHAADRFLYVPSMFAIALFADVVAGAVRTPPARRRAAIGAVALLLGFVVMRSVALRAWTSHERFWRRAVAMAPNSEAPLANLVFVLIGNDWPSEERLDEAEAFARRLHRNASTSEGPFDYAHILANLQLHRRRVEPARALVERAIEFRPRDSTLLCLNGRVAIQSGDPIAAERSYAAAIAIEAAGPRQFVSREAEARAGRAESLAWGGGREHDARADAIRASTLVANADSGARAQLVRAWLRLRQHEHALRALDGGYVVPGRYPELLELASLLGASVEQEEQLAARAEAAGVPFVAIVTSFAKGHERAGRFDRAEALFRHATRMTPDDARAWDGLGYALFAGGDPIAAESAFRTALEKDADYAEARLHLGVLLRRTDRETQGITELERALTAARSQRIVELTRRISKELEQPPGDGGQHDSEGAEPSDSENRRTDE